ncbi:zinc finger protein 14-like [Ornithodoros turicata]
MAIKVFVEATPLVVDLEFPNGLEKGSGLTLVLEDPKQRLQGEDKLGIQFTYVNGDVFPVVRTVTVEDDLSACLRTLQKVRVETTADESGNPSVCVVKAVPKVYPSREENEDDLEFPTIGKVLDCLPGSPTMFPLGSPGNSNPPSENDGGSEVHLSDYDPDNLADLSSAQVMDLDNSEDIDDPAGLSVAESSEQADNACVCTICDYTTDSADGLKYHIRLHAIHGELCCKVCKEHFRTISDFKAHCATHVPVIKESSVESSSKRIKTQVQSSNRRKNSEEASQSPAVSERGPPTLSCCECSRSFASASLLHAHEQSHYETVKQGDKECEICSKTFTTVRGLQLHLKKHARLHQKSRAEAEKSGAKGAEDTADKLASSAAAAASPVAELPAGGTTGFACPLCGRSFDQERKRDHHVVRKHTKAYPFQCSMCRRGFMFQKNLDRHFQDTHSCHYVLNVVEAMDESREGEIVQLSQMKCNYCTFNTFAIGSMQSHLASHPEIRYYACEKCDKEFSSEVRYRRHVETGVCDMKPECDVCGKCLSSMTALRNHKLCHGEDKAFRCSVCDESFKTNTTLKYHVQARHGEIKAFKCEHCSKSFSFAAQKKRHVSRVHLRETNHPCNLCPMKFMTKRELMLHLLCGHKFQPALSDKGKALMPDGTHAPNLKLFQCEYCEYASYSRKGYLRHLVDHTGVWPYACDLCGKGFIERNQAERHIRATHTTESYPCPQCPRVFVLPSSYQEHLQAHTEQQGTSCPHCEKYFETHGLYSLHLQTHSRDLHYRCQVCGQGFSKIAALNFHMIVHKHEKGGPNTWTYSCDVCKKRFKYPGSLAAHKYKHSQDILKKCELCHVTLRTEGLFEVHMRRHRGEKPFKCPYCDKAFTLSMTRKHHVTRFHTGDYHIFCPLCQKGVVSNKMLRRHLYHVHGTVVTKKKAVLASDAALMLGTVEGVAAVEGVDAVESVEAVGDAVETVVETVEFQ